MERIGFNELPQGLYPAMKGMQDFVDHSGLPHSIISLIKLRASYINSCAYCIDMHYKDAIAEGENPQRLYSLPAWRETPYYTPEEQAVLAFTEELTYLRADVNADHIHDELKKFYSKDEIAKLTMTVIAINGWNRFVRSFGPTVGGYKPGAHK
ncbi:carboxymuconolactone decarboxylase family protein [Pseudoflavitalea sp. G-6-1-2]|uniref:carboxymuconolactone decarboxylase family protein n=1 Tax=Pseudoflavitalea sp. G-6-1-2 TaxID=2728841 RepID=UPI00146E21C9|nr:carboxymuconolactone decarboxylase family protein [Pseudoflavitalea sp. G-6-1-2]NML22800.1 carboxymuconolactone decarboxylase family protein [Pseudoflavitalea sp. G-6-1-2]